LLRHLVLHLRTHGFVLSYEDCRAEVDRLLCRFAPLQPVRVRPPEKIPGSFWGEPEAGLVGARIYLRDDTPVHSALHEAAHFVCMDATRRASLHTDAGGDHAEEDAVCYLQVLMADELSSVTRAELFRDMDAWGYSFRLGSARAWFEQDADEARDWLLWHGLVDERDSITFRLRS
jgi:hypothetical protein